MGRIGIRLHPGRVLQEEYMEPFRLDTQGLAEALGIPPSQITPIIVDQERMTPDIALRLARCFRTSPQFWLALQAAYDLSVANALMGAEIEARVRPIAV